MFSVSSGKKALKLPLFLADNISPAKSASASPFSERPFAIHNAWAITPKPKTPSSFSPLW
jgi:hypothetical protein